MKFKMKTLIYLILIIFKNQLKIIKSKYKIMKMKKMQIYQISINKKLNNLNKNKMITNMISIISYLKIIKINKKWKQSKAWKNKNKKFKKNLIMIL